MLTYLAIGLGGSAGAITRHLLSSLIKKHFSHPFPWATWTINISGSFLLGLFVAFNSHYLISAKVEALLVLGFLSSYTTFSTFSVELLQAIQKGFYRIALLYAITSLTLGMLAAYLGLLLGSFRLA
ncbi:CrcB protein [Desulfitispora alkaliphila]|uniref:fluoride efflux transporter CrcB n=1 Tax=Desulfitispora alkaliphila TaxID=622674 RepID=UPI003D1B243C